MNWAWLKSEFLQEGEPPPGWNTNPSSWSQRFAILAPALTGLGIAVYLGLYQVHAIQDVWEPFFGRGSEQVLRESPVARVVPDAFVGAFFYLLEVIFGVLGGRQRWQGEPWAVLIEAVLAVGMGVGSVVLTILQPLLTGTYCTMCLASAFCSVFVVGFAVTEALAALQHLERARRRGQSWWEAFRGEGGWVGRLHWPGRSLQQTTERT
jgi:hypothetical protein